MDTNMEHEAMRELEDGTDTNMEHEIMHELEDRRSGGKTTHAVEVEEHLEMKVTAPCDLPTGTKKYKLFLPSQ